MRLFLLGQLCLWGFGTLTAQECTPDPGPAIFLEDFGSGANPGPALPAGTTTYAYGSIEANHYVISNTTGLNPNFWHDGEDNTAGDDDGYMLIVNADEGAGTFYQRTFLDLCPNTEYIFSSYIANVVIPIACIGDAEKPDIRFSVIDPSTGLAMASMTTGEIFYSSFLTWREYTLPFRTGPDQTNVLIQLTNNAPGGCGNDLALDDLSLRLCNVQVAQTVDLCDLPDGSLTIGANTYTEAGTYLDALPVPNSCNDTLVTTTLTGPTRLLPTLSFNLCLGDTLEIGNRRFTASTSFVDTLPGTDCSLYQPYEINAQSQFSVNQDITLCLGDSLQVGNSSYTSAGTYVDTLATASGCDSVVITNISTSDIAVEVSPTTVEVDLGQSVQLLGAVRLSDDFIFSWQPQEAFSCADCLDPILTPQTSGTYQLVATDIASGCTVSASVQVTVATCEDVFVPTAFSPNFDEINDYLEVFSEDCFTRLLSWRIFDRWGGLVYEATEESLSDDFRGWDGQARGQPAAQGIYGYYLLLERTDGTRKEIRGEVALLR